MLFVYPWSDSNSKADKLLFEGMYTITGMGFNNQNQYDSPIGCQAIYIKVHEKKLITTVSVYGSPDYIDIEYQLEGVNKEENRVYRNGDTAYLVDSEHNIQKVISTYTYNGNKRTDTYWEVVEGDYSADCLIRQKAALEQERMKTTMDLNGWY